MVRYFTKAFFDEVVQRLEADEKWAKEGMKITAKLVLTCMDRASSFLLDIQNGRLALSEVAPDVPADFKFEGPYEAWVQLGKGERDLTALTMTGKIKFRGSLPKIMGMMGGLGRIMAIAQQVPKEF